MKHLYAGLAVGGIAAGVLLITALIHALLEVLVGEPMALALTVFVGVLTVGAVVLDVITERS